MSKFDLNGQTVTLDLEQLKKVLEAAMYTAKLEVERQSKEIEDALFAASATKSDVGSYQQLNRANCAREYLVRATVAYSDALEAYYHVVEATRREEVKTWYSSNKGK